MKTPRVWYRIKVCFCVVVLLAQLFFAESKGAKGSFPPHTYNSSHVGYWQGDLWTPPGGKAYDMQEMYTLLKDRNLWVYGDSLGRRMCSSLALLLWKYHNNGLGDVPAAEIDRDAADSFLKSVGKQVYAFDVPTKGIAFEWSPVLANVTTKSCSVENRMSPTVLDVVIDIGIHDSERSILKPNFESTRAARYEEYLTGMHDALACLTKVRKRRIYWRTAPYAYFGSTEAGQNRTANTLIETQLFNKAARVACARFLQCRIVDAELLLQHKSMGGDRLVGDTPEHYGGVARLAMIQLLIRAMAVH